MFIKKNDLFKTNRLILGTLLNLIQVPLFFEVEDFLIVFLFFVGILFNQYLLFVAVADLTGIKKNNTILPTWFCAVSKLFVLIISFGFALSYTKHKEMILVEMYIFQLIILVISTKRVVKKN